MANLGNGRNAYDTLAARFLADANLTGKPCSAFGLAKAAGLWLKPIRRGRARGLAGSELHYDARASERWRDAAITREVARWAIRWYRLDETDEAVHAVTRALLHRPQIAAWPELVDDVG
jgi:hypothetical protein